jgi:hypothetical protein
MTLAVLLPLAVALGVTPRPESSVLLALRGPDSGRYQIQAIDPATGEAAKGPAAFSLDKTGRFSPSETLSADGRILAVIEPRGTFCEPYGGGESCQGSADLLHLIDLASLRQVTVPLSSEGCVWTLAFSPDHTRLALAVHEKGSDSLVLVNTATGGIKARQRVGFPLSLLRFAPDGGRLIAFGQPEGADRGVSRPGPPHVLLIDGRTLELAWNHELPQIVSGHWCMEGCDREHQEQLHANWRPAVALSRDGRAVHIVEADRDRLTTVDLEARSVRSAEIRPPQTLIGWLLDLLVGEVHAKAPTEGTRKDAVLSQDGTRLFVVGGESRPARDAKGRWEWNNRPLGLQVVAVATGSRLATRESRATGIGSAAGDARLYLAHWSDRKRQTEVIDAATLERVADVSGWKISPAMRLDGRPIILASRVDYDKHRTRLAVLDPRTYRPERSWTVKGGANWVVPEEP